MAYDNRMFGGNSKYTTVVNENPEKFHVEVLMDGDEKEGVIAKEEAVEIVKPSVSNVNEYQQEITEYLEDFEIEQ